MDKSKLNIAFIDLPFLIVKGLTGALQLTGKPFSIRCYSTIQAFLKDHGYFNHVMAFINPNYIQLNLKEFLQIKNNYSSVKWAGIVYAVYDPEVLSALDDTILITNSYESIKCTIDRLMSEENTSLEQNGGDHLTPREKDVLKLMLVDLKNKEIACKLFISVHTVISHRREIFRKTGFHRHYELLNYAISHKIINLEILRME